MTEQASLRIECDGEGKARAVFRTTRSDWIGREGSIAITLKVDVKRSGGIDASEQRVVKSFTIAATENVVELPPAAALCYCYRGTLIEIASVARVSVGGEMVLEVPVDDVLDPPLPLRTNLTGDAEKLVEPADAFSLIANLRAIPPQNRMIAIGILVFGSLFIAVNSFLGIHDQFVPESQTYFYDHTGSDGSESPLEKSLFGSGGAAVALWLALRAQLRRYMTIGLAKGVATPRRDGRIEARRLLEGKARVALEQVRVRVVAANRELGKYTEKSGTKTRTVTFQSPVRAIVLYEAFLPHVPANTPIQNYLSGDVDFAPMFSALYPPLGVGREHGMDVVWEAQLLHPKFVDQEVMGPTTGLSFDDFRRS